MTTSDSQLPGQGGLSVDDVKKIIAVAKAGAADPVSVTMRVFSGLGDRATVSGSVL